MEKVSIIIPCYNGEKFINRSIKSVYMQSYPNIELIVVDDGSSDNSKDIILSWVSLFHEKGFKLNYLYQENGGPGSAINTGLKYVTGDYISFLDADDEYLPDIIKDRVTFLQENADIDVVRSNGFIVKEETKYLFVSEDNKKDIPDVFLALLRGETYNWAGSYMVRAKAVFDFYPDREIYKSRFGQNLQFLLPLTYKKRCGFIDKPHMNYILQENSLSQTKNINDLLTKSLENASGYRDIRLHMVDIIVPNNEKKYYFKNIQAGYWRSIMSIAVDNNEKNLLKTAYLMLKEYDTLTLNDRITYYSLFSKKMVILLRILRKISHYISK